MVSLFKKPECAILSRFKIVFFFSKVSCGNPVYASFLLSVFRLYICGTMPRYRISPAARALTRLDITSLSLSLLSNHFRCRHWRRRRSQRCQKPTRKDCASSAANFFCETSFAVSLFPSLLQNARNNLNYYSSTGTRLF